MFFPVNGDVNYPNIESQSDPHYKRVVLHLPMTGPNNSTSFLDMITATNATRYGDVKISTAQSKWGQGSGYFDGNGDYLKINESSDLNLLSGDFTIELFLKNENPNTTNGGVVICVGSGSGYWQWLVRQNVLQINSYSNSYYDFIANVTLDTNWHHLAWTKSGSTHRLFYDGAALSASGTPPNGDPSLLQGYVGANFNGGATSLTGYIQDLRISKGLARYTDNFTPPSGPLPTRLPESSVYTTIQPSFQQIRQLGL